jgi:hypothetical protein
MVGIPRSHDAWLRPRSLSAALRAPPARCRPPGFFGGNESPANDRLVVKLGHNGNSWARRPAGHRCRRGLPPADGQLTGPGLLRCWPSSSCARTLLPASALERGRCRAEGRSQTPSCWPLPDSVVSAVPGAHRSPPPTRAPLAVRDPATSGGAWPPWVHGSRHSFRALVLDADGRGARAQADARSPVGGRRAGFFPERWRRAGWDRMMDVGSSRLGAFVISNTPRCISVPPCVYIYIYINELHKTVPILLIKKKIQVSRRSLEDYTRAITRAKLLTPTIPQNICSH